MTRITTALLFAVATLFLCHCDKSEPNTSVIQPINPTTNPASTQSDWKSHLGENVTLIGMAVNYKVGAYLYTENGMIGVILTETHWPSDMYLGGDQGKWVKVTGTITERNDLPIIIHNPNDPFEIQGIPVPKDTNLAEAQKRIVLQNVTWEPAIKTP